MIQKEQVQYQALRDLLSPEDRKMDYVCMLGEEKLNYIV